MPTLQEWTFIVVIVGAVGAGVRYIYKTVRQTEKVFDWVKEMKVNHLPHIEARLKRIEKHLGIPEE